MINISGLNKTYGFTKALNDVTVRFEQGKVYGVVGANGSGKTTLFKCIAGMISYDGSIGYALEDMRSKMGFLATEPYLMPYITGREYLRLLCNARKLHKVDLDAGNIFELPLDRYATGYSTGMKKKLALTGVLLQRNEVFILDEPFNGVDVQSNLFITEIIKALKAKGKTLLISSHILSTLTDICDQFTVLREGSIDKHLSLEEFREVESEMRMTEVGDKMERLGL